MRTKTGEPEKSKNLLKGGKRKKKTEKKKKKKKNLDFLGIS